MELGVPYIVDVELWPPNVVVGGGNVLELKIASCDTAGCVLFKHKHPEDRAEEKLGGKQYTPG